MLQNIRSASKGWVAWLIVIAISIPFALWGIERFNTSGTSGDDVIATIGDHEISYYDYFQELNSYNQRLRQQYGDDFDRIDQEKVRRNVLHFMFGRGIIFADASVKGMVISDEQVKRYILENENFQNDDDNFDSSRYLDYLSALNITAPVFENQIRQSEVYNQYTQGFWDSNFLTKRELKQLFQLLNHERRFAYAIFPWDQKKNEIEVTDNEVLLRYEEDKNSFSVPEQVKAEYVSVSIDSLAEKIEYTQQQLKDFYDERQSDFSTPEEREVRHILFAKEDKKIAEEVRLKLLAGEDFAQLAKQYSVDTYSAENGGSLGFIARGVMLEAFENSAFSLAINELSPLIETQFGHHIIEVTEITESILSSYDDIKEQVIQAYRLQQANDDFYEIQEKLSNLAFDHPDSLQQIEEQLGLEPQQTDWFSRASGMSSATLTQYDTFREAAFSPQVKNEKLNSAVLDIQGQEVVVLRIIDVQAAYIQSLEEVKSIISDELIKSKASAKLSEEITQDMPKLRAKQLTWKDFITKYDIAGSSVINLEWLSVAEINKDTPPDQSEVYRIAYQANRPRTQNNNDENGVFIDTKTVSGNIAVIYMTNSRDVKVSDEDLTKDSNVWTSMNDFQYSNIRNATLEVLQPRFVIPQIDTNELFSQ